MTYVYFDRSLDEIKGKLSPDEEPERLDLYNFRDKHKETQMQKLKLIVESQDVFLGNYIEYTH